MIISRIQNASIRSILSRICLGLMVLVGVLAISGQAYASKPTNPNSWTLSNAERAKFLEYYAPVIVKRGNGNKGDHGKDWITNFDFDRDYVFSDNKQEWKNIGRYIDAARSGPNAYYERWQIRPTLYTSLIEYMDGGQKNLVLLYHIYHGLDKDAANNTQLHDWERIEIHISNVSSIRRPGYGERHKFAVITQHARSVREYPGSKNFNLMTTSTGNHLLIFQAEWSRKVGGIHGQELRFVEDSWYTISSDMRRNKKAEVEINGTSNDKNVHYAFVPGSSSAAVAAFNARKLTYQTAPSLTSYYDNDDGTSWSNVRRIQYELQDLADIIPTHWSKSNYQPHWTTAQSEKINVVTPFKNRVGTSISGLQTFYTKSKDPEGKDKRGGYPGKMWFWGVYEIRDVCGSNVCIGGGDDFRDRSYASSVYDSRGKTRTLASQDYPGANRYWNQHDYFVHSGIEDSRKGYEHGYWLTKGWHQPWNGGFDGRWVSLFDDNVTTEPPEPAQLAVTVTGSPGQCMEYARFTAKASGGTGPYTHQWKIQNSIVYSVGGLSSSYTVEAGVPYTVTITDSKGAQASRAVRFNYNCGGRFEFR